MKKIVVISDSFKGTISSSRVAKIAKDCILKYFPDCEVVGLPVADGGEGTVECFLEAVGGEAVSCTVKGPWGEPIEAQYAKIGTVAVVEMAAAAGLPLAAPKLHPGLTTTYGVGQLIAHAVKQGAEKIILGLGGSATNDGGCGCAAALGVKFYNEAEEVFCPTGSTLKDIAKIDVSEAKKLLQGVEVEVMCDIDNPLCGKRGAAYVFAPQKGADAAMVEELDKGLCHLASLMEDGIADLPGAGAAGGFGAGAVAFMGAKLRAGIEVVLDMVEFEKQLQGCDLVITGEGRIDGQSLGGKVPVGVSRRAKAMGVPVVALVGVVGDDADAVYDEGITAVFNTNRAGLPFEKILNRGEEDYRRALESLLRYTKEIMRVAQK